MGGMSNSGRIILLRVTLLCVATYVIQMSSPSFGVMGASRGGIKAELIHREHVTSPLRSEEGVGHREMMSRQFQRSIDRARSLKKRSLVSIPPGSPSSIESNLTFDPQNEYLMSVSLGTPAQKFTVIADTGSDLPWLQCAPCESCYNQTDAVFDPSLSSTYEILPCVSAGCASLILETSENSYGVQSCHRGCQFDYVYGDGSNTSGTFSSDTLNLMSVGGDEFPVSDFWFGCSRASSGFEPADGLFGLGQGLTSLPSQLSNPQSSNALEDTFSYCLVSQSFSTVQSSRFVFGHDALLDNIQLQYTPHLHNTNFYYVSLEGITVNGGAVNFNASDLALLSDGTGGTIFDSGTALTNIGAAAYDPMLSSIIEQVPTSVPRTMDPEGHFDLCYTDSTSLLENSVPRVSLKFAGDSRMDLSFANTWALIDPENSLWCFAMARSDDNSSIIGNFQQQDYHVLYDRVDFRIGFAATDCAAVGQ